MPKHYYNCPPLVHSLEAPGQQPKHLELPSQKARGPEGKRPQKQRCQAATPGTHQQSDVAFGWRGQILRKDG